MIYENNHIRNSIEYLLQGYPVEETEREQAEKHRRKKTEKQEREEAKRYKITSSDVSRRIILRSDQEKEKMSSARTLVRSVIHRYIIKTSRERNELITTCYK